MCKKRNHLQKSHWWSSDIHYFTKEHTHCENTRTLLQWKCNARDTQRSSVRHTVERDKCTSILTPRSCDVTFYYSLKLERKASERGLFLGLPINHNRNIVSAALENNSLRLPCDWQLHIYTLSFTLSPPEERFYAPASLIYEITRNHRATLN